MSTLKIPTPLRGYVKNLAEVPVEGKTVGEAVEYLVSQYPALKPHLYNPAGELRPFVNLFLGADNVRDLGGLTTPLPDGALLRLIPSIAGGAE